MRDHATAVGSPLLEDDSAAAACEVLDPATLLAGPPRADRPLPLLVVVDAVDESAVPSAVWEAALAAGARAVLPLPARSDRLLAELAALSRPDDAALVVGVAGGCGGAGTSSLAARLAGAAGRSRSSGGAGPEGDVTLVDADPLGGGLDLLVEAPPTEGGRWREAAALRVEDGEALRESLPRVDGIRLLTSGPDGAGASAPALAGVLAALRPRGGTVVVDLGADLVPAAARQLDRLLVLVPASDHAVRAAARRLDRWDLPPGLAALVVRRRGPLAPGEVAADLGLPLAADFRDSPRGAVPLLDVRRRGADRACQELLEDLRDGGAR
ncbi:hypothetical protein C1N80_05740 [Brachybacterium sp. SGAir0954]|nr:hypothetical protein C1N80_05740 [Brachybacterium sp. SGAir0954]